MGREKINVGASGEKIAAVYLRKMGYRILATNFRTPFGEIDMVTRHKGIVVFIEVRSRTTSSFGPPYLSITATKQKHIIRNSLFYLKMCRLVDAAWRIDIVSIKLNFNRELENIELIENAVQDDYR